MINGFSNDKVNVNIRYINFPTAMTDKFDISHDTLNVFRIHFNNIFKNEKIMYATIAVLISFCSLLAGYTIYYIYDLYQTDAHPIKIKEEFIADTSTLNNDLSNLDVLYNAELGSSPAGNALPSGSNTFNVQPPNDGGGVSALTVPRKGRKIIEIDDIDNNNNYSDITIATRENKVKFTVNDKERTNPFVPYTNALGATPKVNYPEPVSSIPEESDAGTVMKTTISGILYDTYNPSAIINIQGADYLVKTGDTINRFKILKISPNSVTVRLGSNVYSAGVGEQISGKLEYNTISNLNEKFGGSVGIDRMIYNTRERL